MRVVAAAILATEESEFAEARLGTVCPMHEVTRRDSSSGADCLLWG
jgi:hypothetical protein